MSNTSNTGNPQTKRLGRGLAALLGDAASPSTLNAPGVQTLPVDVLEPSPFQPRRAMDETALQELADSITQRGILQPLLVRPHPSREGHYQIIAGERRWRASQRAQLHDVPVLVRPLSDTDAMAAGLVENLQREDLNAVDEAEGYHRLIREFGMTQEALGDAVGKSRAHIGHFLRMLKLPEPVLGLVREGALTAGHARALSLHPTPMKAAKQIIDKNMSVRQAEELVSSVNRVAPAAKSKPERRRLDDTEALAKTLSETLGLKVKISFNGKGGAVTLTYTTLDQLDEVIKRLNG